MSADPDPTILTAALAAHDAGLCVIRAKTDGTKAPLGKWEHYQHQRPTADQVMAWFAHGHPGMGVVCGNVSGDLEMFELEGLFMREKGSEFKKKVEAAGLSLLFQRLINGFQMESPKGGRNFLYRVDGPIDGNTKLARRPATPEELATDPDDKVKTLVETRGEGGFVVLAPSHGPTHPSGKPWKVREGSYAGIPTITADERQALHAVARTFDQAPVVVPTPPAPTGTHTAPQAWTGHAVGGSWFDAVVEHVKATVDMQALLERHGWTYCYTDNRGRKLLRRPGKDEGVSGSINERGRFNPMSTSVPFASGGGGPMAPTYDQLDVIAVYEHSGDRKAAGRHIAETTGILDTWKHTQDTSKHPPGRAGVDTVTGEVTRTSPTNLPDTFWNSRPVLAHIRQAAHSRARSADAVLLFTLARVAACIPPAIKLPAIVGGPGSLNFLGAPIGTSGAGKSTAGAVARELAPINRKDVVADLPLGSGEGLVELFFEWVPEEQPDGKTKKVKRQTRSGLYLYLDEGQALGEMGGRKGATLLPTLRSGWAGETIGNANATQETYRVLMPHTYRLALIVGFQAEYAIDLINDAAGGTPQRFVFASAVDPNVPKKPLEWPGPIDMWLPPTAGETFIELDPDIRDEVYMRNVLATRGEYVAGAMDSHRDLVRLKVAALLAWLDRRLDVNRDDWELAGDVMTTSDAVRTWVVEIARQKARETEEGYVRKAVSREMAALDASEKRALVSGAKSIARRVHKAGPLGKGDALKAVSSKHRAIVPIEEMLHHAETEGWIVANGDSWQAGESRPS